MSACAYTFAICWFHSTLVFAICPWASSSIVACYINVSPFIYPSPYYWILSGFWLCYFEFPVSVVFVSVDILTCQSASEQWTQIWPRPKYPHSDYLFWLDVAKLLPKKLDQFPPVWHRNSPVLCPRSPSIALDLLVFANLDIKWCQLFSFDFQWLGKGFNIFFYLDTGLGISFVHS